MRVGNHETFVRDEGRGEPLVLVHGVAFDHRMWADVVAQLGPSVRAIVYDLRAHGADGGAAAPRDYSQLATDLVGLLDHLGLERVHLAGLSLGGQVVQQVALDHPARVASLSLICTRAAPFPPFAEAADIAERDGIEGQVAGALERWFGPAAVAADEAPVRYARERLASCPPQTWAACLRLIAGFDAMGRLPELEVPTLLVAAELDGVARPEHMREMATRLGGARFELVDGGRHMLCFQEPALLGRLLTDLVERAARFE